jgi:hypothetical protein
VLRLPGPPGAAFGLRALGFTLVNQANNHSLDCGAAGRAQTVAAPRAAGIAHTGFPGEITVLRVHGLRVAFLGFAPYPYDAELSTFLRRRRWSGGRGGGRRSSSSSSTPERRDPARSTCRTDRCTTSGRIAATRARSPTR